MGRMLGGLRRRLRGSGVPGNHFSYSLLLAGALSALLPASIAGEQSADENLFSVLLTATQSLPQPKVSARLRARRHSSFFRHPENRQSAYHAPGYSLTTEVEIPEGYHLNRELLRIRLGQGFARSGWELAPLGSQGAEFPAISGEAQRIRYYTGSLTLPQLLWRSALEQPDSSAEKEREEALELRLDYQLCDEQGNCFLPSSLNYRVSVPGVRNEGARLERRHGLGYWLGVLLLSLLAGVLLNLMPCIFPIFSLKLQNLLRLAAAAHNKGRSMRNSGVCRSLFGSLLGIELSFALLGLLLLPGHIALWGFQLQQAIVIYAVLLLFFTMGLSLLRVFRLCAPHIPGFLLGTARAKGRTQFAADVGHGALIVVLGTPCSAPLLGPLLALFLLQGSPGLSFSGLLFIGLGLWLPYAVLLSAGGTGLRRSIGALQRHMLLVEELLGFVLLATALFFYSVLQKLTTSTLALRVLAVLLLLSWTAWLGGRIQRFSWQRHKPAVVVWALSMGALLWLGGSLALSLLPSAPGAAGNSTSFSNYARLTDLSAKTEGPAIPDANDPEFFSYSGSVAERVALDGLLEQGYGAFVEYTAAWCVTCKFNQSRLLHSKRFHRLLRQHRIFYLKADLTRSNSLLEAEINALGRASLPLYLLYLPQESWQTDATRSLLLPTFPRYSDFEQVLGNP